MNIVTMGCNCRVCVNIMDVTMGAGILSLGQHGGGATINGFVI